MIKLLDILKSFIPTLETLPNLASISTLGPAWLFGVLGTVAVALYGLSLGRTRAVMSLLAIYAAFAFDVTLPYLENIHQASGSKIEIYWLRTTIFLSAYIVIFTIFNFSFIKKRLSSAEFSLFGVVLISLFQLGLLVSIVFSFLPESLVRAWTLDSFSYLGTQQALFLWVIVPLPTLLLLKEK